MVFKKEIDFENHPWESFLFLDIETVSRVPELMENTPLYDSFEYKMRYAEESQRKDFSAYNLKALYANKAALYPEYNKIVCITVGKIVAGKLVIYSFKGHDEYKILSSFNKALQDWVFKDPQLALCGINLKFFDLRNIYIRSVVNKVRPVKGHINLTGLKPWDLFTLDLTDIWKQTSMYNAPMISMAECLGLPSPKSDIDGSMVSETYWKEGDKGLKRVVEYCERDVLTTANIARMLRFEEILERASDKETKEVKAEKVELPPLLQKTFNVGSLTEEDEKLLIKKTRRASNVERERLLDIIQAIQGKEPVDENFINLVKAK